MSKLTDLFERPRVTALLASYVARRCSPLTVVDAVFKRISAVDRPEVWIALLPEDAARAQARALEDALAEEGDAVFERLPLFGVPFAVKDNVDVAGLPTTAACEPFSYTPDMSAFAVQRLLDAGAILIGKTNLDQFATGLVGTRRRLARCVRLSFPRMCRAARVRGRRWPLPPGALLFRWARTQPGPAACPQDSMDWSG